MTLPPSVELPLNAGSSLASSSSAAPRDLSYGKCWLDDGADKVIVTQAALKRVTAVDERHLAVHQPRPDGVGRFGQGVQRVEDGVTRGVAPPASADRFASDHLG